MVGRPLDAVVMIGHHARTPSPKGFCSHTFVWGMEVLLDGDSLSETQVYGQALAAEGIPILVAAGDRWLLEEMEEGELGGARLLATKEGEGRGRARSTDPADLLTEIATVFRASQVSREYRQLAKLLPSDHASRLRGLQRRLGSLLATPVMRSKERAWLAAAPQP